MSENSEIPNLATTNSHFYKFLKFSFWLLQICFVASIAVVVMVFCDKEWHPELVRFISRTWDTFVADKVGSTSPGFVNSLAVSGLLVIVAFIAILFLQGMSAMKQHAFETVAMGIVSLAAVTFLVYGTQFAWQVAKAGYKEHNDSSFRIRQLASAPKPICPTCPICAPEKKCSVKPTLTMYSSGIPSRYSDAPEGRVLLITTNHDISAPYSVYVKCESPITKAGVDFWSAVEGNFLAEHSERFSDGAYEATISTPPFTAKVGVLITIYGTRKFGHCSVDAK